MEQRSIWHKTDLFGAKHRNRLNSKGARNPFLRHDFQPIWGD
jgi:hypothetical protein